MTWPSKDPDDYMKGAARQEPSQRAVCVAGVGRSVGLMLSVYVLVGDGVGVVLRALAAIGAGLVMFSLGEWDARRKRGRSKRPPRTA
jgi:hypothetical protein